MKFLLKMIYKILISSFLFTLSIGIHPLQVSAASFSTICPGISLAPTDEVYEMLPKYDALEVLNADRECMHNFTKKSTKQNIEPSITVLTHGLGGDPSHWSNNNINQNLEYDPESIIEKIRSLDFANTDVYEIQNEVSQKPDNSFKIVKLEIDSVNDSFSRQEVDFSSKELGRKIVILFKSSDFIQHNITDYLELDYIIDYFSYKYFLDHQFIPKINLIGHSRGGLTNLQYVNEHPYNVDAVLSIDTPYFGSEFGQMPVLMDLLGFTGTIESCGGQDILDTGYSRTYGCDVPLQASDSGSGTLHQTYLDGFELATTMNDQIRAYAIGSSITFDGIFHVLARMMIDTILTGNENIMAELSDNEDFKSSLDIAIIALDVVNFIVSPESLISFSLTVVDLVVQFVEEHNPAFLNQLNQDIDTVPYLSILNNISSSVGLILDENIEVINPFIGTEPVLEDDLFIHLDSQLGDTGYQDYGFT